MYYVYSVFMRKYILFLNFHHHTLLAQRRLSKLINVLKKCNGEVDQLLVHTTSAINESYFGCKSDISNTVAMFLCIEMIRSPQQVANTQCRLK
jgi:hypothetical protein